MFPSSLSNEYQLLCSLKPNLTLSFFNVKYLCNQPKFKIKNTLIMYDNEARPMCSLVREAISELNLDVLIIPCPKGGERHKQQLREMYSTDKFRS